jgi:hypothetical protein
VGIAPRASQAAERLGAAALVLCDSRRAHEVVDGVADPTPSRAAYSNWADRASQSRSSASLLQPEVRRRATGR